MVEVLPATVDVVIGQRTLFIFRVFLIVGNGRITDDVQRLLWRHCVDATGPFSSTAHAVFRLEK